MTVIEFEVKAKDVEDVRRRLGNTGHVRGAMGDMLDQSARVGEQSAEMYAPERSRRLKREISSTPARETETLALEATVGVSAVRALAGGGAVPLREGQDEYPLYVHEGTGLFGSFHRMIRPRARRAMRWYGQTGLVFAKATRGQRPKPYIREAYDDVLVFLPAAIDRMVHRILDDKL